MVALERDFTSGRNRLSRMLPFAIGRTDRRFLVAMLLALIGIRLLVILWLPVTDTTEARYIEIARKMLASGDWINPQFDVGVPFWGKPPLHTWLSALGMKLFGVGYFGARILIFLTAIATGLLCLGWVRRDRGLDQGLVAVAVMGSSLLFFGASAFVMTDMVMVMGTTLGMIAFYRSVQNTRDRRLWGHLFFLSLAIGLLAKGPVAVVLTGIPLFLWLLIGNRWHLLRGLPWKNGLLLMGMLSLPWYLAAEIRTPGFLRYFIIGEHVQRFLAPGWSGDLYGNGHVEPKGMIWLFAIGAFLPWSLFAAALLLRSRAVAVVLRRDDQGWYSYLAFWALSPLILFTPAANILPAYALPALPPAAILLTSLWAESQGRPGQATRLAVGLVLTVMAGLYLGVAIIAQVAPAKLTTKTELMLIEKQRQIDPDMALTYWGGRSYSGEFYSRGTAGHASDPGEIRALLSNHRRDAIAVPSRFLSQITTITGTHFDDMGIYGRRHLLVEKPREKEEQ
ncbi:ArnT family glycosyltransferase [Paracoccus seriniphilus]|uniref:4-amino-4-deoxy-L-arabinose transferase n=1 Tax=Paracoccus seriniphilus TaxID=184748 RepID=A0A239Q263_9RHOB|nr:glycosyltransferase family 39 protein [Paracoccus seriniphilus]WCR16200.1 glycosyltransferase family 39 protein [Paracoccus seriniphilus]SNT76530.1 4-amino-4-deoxy-L-arabinose transferase [Paracoccus seriniphilus]